MLPLGGRIMTGQRYNCCFGSVSCLSAKFSGLAIAIWQAHTSMIWRLYVWIRVVDGCVAGIVVVTNCFIKKQLFQFRFNNCNSIYDSFVINSRIIIDITFVCIMVDGMCGRTVVDKWCNNGLNRTHSWVLFHSVGRIRHTVGSVMRWACRYFRRDDGVDIHRISDPK